MIITGSIGKVREVIKTARQQKKVIGFVPTMGALHKGHLSLIKKAGEETDFVVVSIFVNPIQFGKNEDYTQYPRNLPADTELLRKEKVDLLFSPSVKTMYPANFSVYVEETQLSKYLCGKIRKGHFRGVCTVVVKLFNIIQPDISYFGQKDYQQALIIKRLVRDLNYPIKIKMLPIVRESNGLAMSSRNNYLTEEERNKAKCLFNALNIAKELIKKGEKEPRLIIKKMKTLIKNVEPSAKIDYISIVNPYTLEDIESIHNKVLIALAMRIGITRLIDNMLVKAPQK